MMGMVVPDPGSGAERARISVVIPTYNSARFLAESIDSVLAQQLPPQEVIVVDGPSTDDTPAICRSYGERIWYLKQSGKGYAAALNQGVESMTGDWYMEQDGDDILEPDALKVLSREAASTRAKIIYSDFAHVDVHGRHIRDYRAMSSEPWDDFAVECWRWLVATHLGSIVHRSCFDVVGPYDETLGMAEDYDWSLRAALVHRLSFRHVPRVLARYRRHPAQGSRWSRSRWLRNRRTIHDKVRGMLLSGSVTDPRLYLYYGEVTRQFRRRFAPFVAAAPLLGKPPRSVSAAYYLSKLMPRTTSRIYWALNPPVGP